MQPLWSGKKVAYFDRKFQIIISLAWNVKIGHFKSRFLARCQIVRFPWDDFTLFEHSVGTLAGFVAIFYTASVYSPRELTILELMIQFRLVTFQHNLRYRLDIVIGHTFH